MGLSHSPKILTEGLAFCIDAANKRSYSGSGTTLSDLSGNQHSGTLTNGPVFSNTDGGCLVFDGTNDYVTFPGGGSLEISDVLTASVWVYYISGNGRIFQKDASGGYTRCWEIGGYGGNFRIEMWHSDGTTVGAPTGGALTQNAWTHLAMTFDGSQIKMYKNTQLVRTLNFAGDIRTASNTPLILGGLWGTGEYLNGKISNAQLYNRALFSDEIRRNYLATKSRFGL